MVSLSVSSISLAHQTNWGRYTWCSTAGRAQERRDAQRALDGVRQLYELDHQGSLPNQCSQSPAPRSLTSSAKLTIYVLPLGQDGERFWKLPEAYIRGNNVSRSPIPLPSTLASLQGELRKQTSQEEILTHSSTPSPAQIKYIRVAESVSPPCRLSLPKQKTNLVHTNPLYSVPFTIARGSGQGAGRRESEARSRSGRFTISRRRRKWTVRTRRWSRRYAAGPLFFFLSSFHKHASSRDVN